ncbi:hypothetical protein ACTWP5_23955 [Streptomyces sp. 4N509B]|uniref:hypothetical protein n=1 Tax=Streptomyces sp. 4N509B TaxID=3457413 RepID=UPI003FD14FD5
MTMGFPPPPPPGAPSPPPPYPAASLPPPTAPPPSAGFFVALVGLLVLGLGMGALEWITFEVEESADESLRINAVAGAFHGDDAREALGGFAYAHLQYLCWLNALAASLTALLACWPQPVSGSRAALRALAALTGAFGVVATVLLAVGLMDAAEEIGGSGDPAFELMAGPWVAVAGFALLALGGLLGPPRARPSLPPVYAAPQPPPPLSGPGAAW